MAAFSPLWRFWVGTLGKGNLANTFPCALLSPYLARQASGLSGPWRRLSASYVYPTPDRHHTTETKITFVAFVKQRNAFSLAA